MAQRLACVHPAKNPLIMVTCPPPPSNKPPPPLHISPRWDIFRSGPGFPETSAARVAARSAVIVKFYYSVWRLLEHLGAVDPLGLQL